MEPPALSALDAGVGVAKESIMRTSPGSTIALLAAASIPAAALAWAPDPIGPDCVNSSLNDMARHGTNAAGTILGFSSGSVTCNRGDAQMVVSVTTTVRPLVAMNMYRFTDNGSYSRLVQLGQGWAKWVAVPGGGTNASCGPACGGNGAGTMGPSCADVYSSGFNSPGSMCPRSRINATLGTLTGARGGGTDEANINTRVQVLASDLNNQPAGTRFFFETVDALPDDAQFVRASQTVAVNAMNNATSQELSIANASAVPTMLATATVGLPAIARWAQLDPDVTIATADHDDTPNPSPSFPGSFIRSRFYVAAAASPLPGGFWRYEIVVFNLNSDRSCGGLSIPLPAGASFGDAFLRHPPVHSGEAISNTPWSWSRNGNLLTVSTDPYSRDPNANAIRWGTMYNFGFTTNATPATGPATLALFKPGSLASIQASGLPLPGALPCPADADGDAAVDANDLVLYLDRFEAGSPLADLSNNGSGGPGSPDGGVDINDLIYYLIRYEGGC